MSAVGYLVVAGRDVPITALVAALALSHTSISGGPIQLPAPADLVTYAAASVQAQAGRCWSMRAACTR